MEIKLSPRHQEGEEEGLGGRSPLCSFPPRVHGGRFPLTCPKSQLRGVAAIFPASLHL